MLEVFVPVAVAACTGLAVLTSQIHRRVHSLDNRLDGVELKVAENYVTRNELSEALTRFEAHMVRIENKLDKITN